MAASLLDSTVAEADVCDLTTIGRVSGEPHAIEIWFAAVGDRLYLLAGGRESAHWVRNVAANPAVRVMIDGRRFRGSARAIEGEADDRLARELLAGKYQGWTPGRRLTQWARESLPVAIDLDAEEKPRSRKATAR
jgi:deazaflavin-dependent oxidoreductase (nitroreductase family)